MARRAGGEGSPKKNTSLNLVTGFYHYLRGKWDSVCMNVCPQLEWIVWEKEGKYVVWVDFACVVGCAACVCVWFSVALQYGLYVSTVCECVHFAA